MTFGTSGTGSTKEPGGCSAWSRRLRRRPRPTFTGRRTVSSPTTSTGSRKGPNGNENTKGTSDQGRWRHRGGAVGGAVGAGPGLGPVVGAGHRQRRLRQRGPDQGHRRGPRGDREVRHQPGQGP